MSDHKWRVIPGQALHHYVWDEQYVVFNTLSGDTHLLGAGSMQLLAALADVPSGTAALSARLQAELQLDEQEIGEIPLMLDELYKLALIEPERC